MKKSNAFCWMRLLAGLLLFMPGVGQGGGLRLAAQQIDAIGPRLWLGLMAGTVIANTPVLAPVSQRIARRFARPDIEEDAGDATVDRA